MDPKEAAERLNKPGLGGWFQRAKTGRELFRLALEGDPSAAQAVALSFSEQPRPETRDVLSRLAHPSTRAAVAGLWASGRSPALAEFLCSEGPLWLTEADPVVRLLVRLLQGPAERLPPAPGYGEALVQALADTDPTISERAWELASRESLHRELWEGLLQRPELWPACLQRGLAPRAPDQEALFRLLTMTEPVPSRDRVESGFSSASVALQGVTLRHLGGAGHLDFALALLGWGQPDWPQRLMPHWEAVFRALVRAGRNDTLWELTPLVAPRCAADIVGHLHLVGFLPSRPAEQQLFSQLCQLIPVEFPAWSEVLTLEGSSPGFLAGGMGLVLETPGLLTVYTRGGDAVSTLVSTVVGGPAEMVWAASQDGRSLAVAARGVDRPDERRCRDVEVWDPVAGRRQGLYTQSGAILDLALSVDGSRLAVLTPLELLLWDRDGAQPRHRLRLPEEPAERGHVFFSPRADIVFVNARGFFAWETHSGRTRYVLPPARNAGRPCASEDGLWLAAPRDQELLVWGLESGQVAARRPSGGMEHLRAWGFRSDQRLVLAFYDLLEIWAPGEEAVQELRQSRRSYRVALDTRGGFLVSSEGEERDRLKFFSLTESEYRHFLEAPGRCEELVLASDGTALAAGCHSGKSTRTRLWTPFEDKLLKQLGPEDLDRLNRQSRQGGSEGKRAQFMALLLRHRLQNG